MGFTKKMIHIIFVENFLLFNFCEKYFFIMVSFKRDISGKLFLGVSFELWGVIPTLGGGEKLWGSSGEGTHQSCHVSVVLQLIPSKVLILLDCM